MVMGYLYNFPLPAAEPPKIGGIMFNNAKGIAIRNSRNINRKPMNTKVRIKEIKNRKKNIKEYISKLI